MEICAHNKCTGCYACISACPRHCISMEEDDYGELHPVINEDRCVQCNVCIRTCPSNVDIPKSYPQTCYASWITDRVKRKICASGGLGTIMAEFAIRYHHGVVFGTAYDDTFTPRVTYADTLEGIEQFKGSKYVQSIVGENTYKDVKTFLMDNRFVLFIGTPCQIAGLKSYLNRDYKNLITVDLICHGVSPTRYFKEEMSYLINKHKISKLCDIRFRGNDNNNFALTLWSKQNVGATRCYKRKAFTDYYMAGFLLGVTLRDNCYSCKYATPERISDITIGDFIGLGKLAPFPYSESNVSSVTINTKNATLFYQELCEKMSDLFYVERRYEERLMYKPSLVVPYERHPLSVKFRELYRNSGWHNASRESMHDVITENRRKEKKENVKNIIVLPYRLIKKFCRVFGTNKH